MYLFSVTYDAATAKHDHTISVDGKVVSTLPVSSPDNLGVFFTDQHHVYSQLMISLQSPDEASDSEHKSNANLILAARSQATNTSTRKSFLRKLI